VKSCPFSVNASCVIIILKPFEHRVSPSTRGKHPVIDTLYIYYIFNSNNDADDATQAGSEFPARHHPCRLYFFLFHDAPCRSESRHYSYANFTLYAGGHS